MSYLKSIYILLFIIVIAVASACKNKPATDKLRVAFSMSDTMMAKCQLSTAILEDVRTELKLFGKITPDNSKQVEVYPTMSGNVLSIPVELGDYVKQGQVLATVRSSEVADFQRQHLDAKADLALAEKNLQVSKDLFAGNINSEKDVIAAEKELQKAKAELSRINEVYNIYNLKDGSEYNITAPMSGFIVFKDVAQNEQLRADKSDAIFSIAQIEDVWVLANVNESDISKVSIGLGAEIKTISYPDITFTGKIDRIFNAIDPNTKAMKVLIKIPNKQLLLKPEMNATVTLRYAENKKMIAIPSSSVIFDKSKNWVMVFKDRTNVETRLVDVYHQLGLITYIQAGLKENEKVISRNGLMIYDALND
jgi:cobalt-zinc-cadmium efflux system membrane fusion protein